MPGQRIPPTKLSLSSYVLDIIIVSLLLLISHVHVDEAQPLAEQNTPTSTAWHESAAFNARRLSPNANYNNNNRAVAAAAAPRSATHTDAESTDPMTLPSGKQHNPATSEDGPTFTNNPDEGSGGGGLDEAETDDSGEGDDDDYDDDDQRPSDTMDLGSGSHESKYNHARPVKPIQLPPDNPDVLSKGEEQAQSETITTTKASSTVLNSTISAIDKPANSKQNMPNTTFTVSHLTTTQEEVQSTAASAVTTINFAPPTLSSINTTPTPPGGEDQPHSTARPASLATPSVTKLPNSSIFDGDNGKVFGNSSYDYEGEEEDEDDNEDSTNFEDNIPSDAKTHPNASHHNDLTPTTENYPILETISTQPTIAITSISSPSDPLNERIPSTTTNTTSRPTTIAPSTASPMNTNTLSTITPDDDDNNDHKSTSTAKDDAGDDDGDGDNDNDNDDDEEDDVDDLEDIDSDISELSTNSSTGNYDEPTTEYSGTVDIKVEEIPATINTTTVKVTTVSPSENPKIGTIFTTQVPSVIMGSRVEEPKTVQETYPNLILRQKNFDIRSLTLSAQPILILLVLGSTVTGLFVAILIVMFIVYRIRRQQERM